MSVEPTIAVVLAEPDGRRHALAARSGQSLMRAAVDAGIDGIKADCGGVMTCATCHVYVDAPWLRRLPALSADEDAMLEMTAAPRAPSSRLSCQIQLDGSLDGLVATLPATQY
ncbi:MAG: 2Fe-2S iron-sulfur cluster-binding protein [Caldimonas sp.]